MAANGAKNGHDRIMGHRQDLTLLSERIHHLRCGAGLTQEALAGWIGVTPAAVRSYEAGRAAPRPAHLEAMAEALGVRPEHLVTWRIDAGDTLASALFQLGDTYGLDPVWYEGRAHLVPTSRFMAGTISTWANWHEALRAGTVSREEYDAWRRRFAAPFDALDCPSRIDAATGEPIEPWVHHRIARALTSRRKAIGMSQGALAGRLGLSVGVWRSYEHGRRVPMESLVSRIAAALGVTAGSLTFFDFGTPVQAAHALFQIAEGHGLSPERIGRMPCLVATGAVCERVLRQWALALDGTYEDAGDGVATLDEWKSRYDPGPAAKPPSTDRPTPER